MSDLRRVLFVQHQDDCPPGYVGDRLAQQGVAVDVVRAQTGGFPDPAAYDLVVPLGSDDSAYDESLPYLKPEWELLSAAVDAGVPVFGICFGAQLLSRVLGGRVYRSPSGPEIGWLRVESTDPALLEPGPWMVWHLDVLEPPPGSVVLARTPVACQAYTYGPHVGVQFHPEATVDSIISWARNYEPSLRAASVDAEELLAETRAGQDAARRRAYTLTDRIVARAARVLDR